MADYYHLDAKDIKLLAALDEDARQSNNEIGRKARLSKEVVKYRIDRLVETGVILRFHTVVNYFKLGMMKFKLYLRLANADREKLEEIGEYFFSHKKTEWVALTTGRWDIVVGFIAHNVNEFDDEVQAALELFSPFIQEKAMSTTLHLIHLPRSFLRKEINKKVSGHISPTVYHTLQDPQEKIDDVDDSILKIIANNARMPVTEIAKRLKTTSRIVQYRLREMERKDIILAYRAHLAPKAMGNIFCKALVYAGQVSKQRLKNFINYTSSLEGAVWPQRVMAAWDFELDLELESYEAFQNALLELKEKFPDVIRNIEFCIVSKEFKLDLYPGCLPKLG